MTPIMISAGTNLTKPFPIHRVNTAKEPTGAVASWPCWQKTGTWKGPVRIYARYTTPNLHELLLTAHFYDPEDTVVTYSMIAGMIIMAVSLVLFLI